jgi:hypothetical protein
LLGGILFDEMTRNRKMIINDKTFKDNPENGYE